ncbi:MAG: hypothetical protein ACI89G_003218, partial [Minisyncoccia bacterium]
YAKNLSNRGYPIFVGDDRNETPGSASRLG